PRGGVHYHHSLVFSEGLSMRWLARFARLGAALVAALVALLLAAFAWLGIPATGAGLAAKTVCSGVFVAGRAFGDVVANDLLPASGLLRFVHLDMDAGQHEI